MHSPVCCGVNCAYVESNAVSLLGPQGWAVAVGELPSAWFSPKSGLGRTKRLTARTAREICLMMGFLLFDKGWVGVFLWLLKTRLAYN